MGRFFVDQIENDDSLSPTEPRYMLLSAINLCMVYLGWTFVPFEFGDPREWYDNYHPRSHHVVEFMVSFIRNQIKLGAMNPGEYLVLFGDSTTAYSVDRKGDTTFACMAEQIRKATGVNVWFSSMSGTWFSDRHEYNEETNTWFSLKDGFHTCAINVIRKYPTWKPHHVMCVGGWNVPDGVSQRRFNFVTRKFNAAVSRLLEGKVVR